MLPVTDWLSAVCLQNNFQSDKFKYLLPFSTLQFFSQHLFTCNFVLKSLSFFLEVSISEVNMSTLPTDEELLACPEAVELRFVHRRRRDMIASQAGK